MNHSNQENERLRSLLRKLLEAETGEDSMICHDGGFRYSGDFMSMEDSVLEPASILTRDERRKLLERGYIEVLGGQGPAAVSVTDAGRVFAFEDSAIR